MKASAPDLPQVARALLKSFIVGLEAAGLITAHQATLLIAVLELHDA